MKYLCIMLLALGVAGCGSTQEPVQPPTAGSVLQVSSGLGEKHPGFEITIPVAQVLHPIPITYAPTRTFFAWRPVSTNVAPRQVRWILLATPEFGNDFMATLEYVRTHPDEATWSPWTDYKPALNEGTFWYSPLLSDGRYVFAVQGRTIKGISDGGFDLGRNVRFLEISHYYDHGPVVRLSGTFFEPFEST